MTKRAEAVAGAASACCTVVGVHKGVDSRYARKRMEGENSWFLNIKFERFTATGVLISKIEVTMDSPAAMVTLRSGLLFFGESSKAELDRLPEEWNQ